MSAPKLFDDDEIAALRQRFFALLAQENRATAILELHRASIAGDADAAFILFALAGVRPFAEMLLPPGARTC